MPRSWSVLCLAGVIGCSETRNRTGLSGDLLEAGATTGSLTSDSAGTAGGQPTVMFSCEEGRVTAYVVTGPLDGAISREQMVPISLDSAPDC